MDLFLSKVVTQIAYPLCTSLLLAALAGLLQWRGRRGLGGGLLLLALGWLWLWSTPQVSEWLRGSLERRYTVVPLAQLPPADAIVVLGGGVEGVHPPERLQPNLMAGADRVWQGAQLYRAGKAPRVVLSGGYLQWGRSRQPEAEAMQTLIRDFGVPDEALILEGESRNTHQNALYTRALLERHGLRRVLLVTSALHMPRALAAFRAAGIEVIPVPSDVEVVGQHTMTVLDWLPDAAALEGSSRALKEYLGLWVYRLRGWS
ncbi:MAG TPA: YdcF family protein [Candidatus Competibacteraceae bacterium]|nr:YdcF family protein [Candidatus Competibacteraceae bacterium]